MTTDNAFNLVAQAIINDKKAFEKLKKSMSWRLSDVMISERLNLRDEVRAIIIEELPKALDVWFIESFQSEED
tara:strand:+ start:233 stop:451 length:219 start_codon:yes stop_codon:yes gene_type:complete